MIDRTFLHCPGIGPKTDERLKAMGFASSNDCLSRPADLPLQKKKRERFLDDLRTSQSALENQDIDFLVAKLPTREHWRILGAYFQKATFFDIETTGLYSYDSHPTVIVAFHQEKLRTFVYGENLVDFLDLIDECELLVAFNGNSFDIPFLENTFNIPQIGCPHVDLRWIAFHEGYCGGLKAIEKQMRIFRPHEIGAVDGFEAVNLYHRWQKGDLSARQLLVRYCQTDTLATYLVAGRILQEIGLPVPEIKSETLFDMVFQPDDGQSPTTEKRKPNISRKVADGTSKPKWWLRRKPQ